LNVLKTLGRSCAKSDRAIIEKSGILDKINPGDLILADRGFTIEDLLIARQASIQ
jgi:hypothetical protein